MIETLSRGTLSSGKPIIRPFTGKFIARSTAHPIGIFTGTAGSLKRVRGVDALLFGKSKVAPDDVELYRPLRKTLRWIE